MGTLVLVCALFSGCLGIDSEAGRAGTAQAEDFDAWSSQVDRLWKILPRTARLADHLAILDELASLVGRTVRPRERYLDKLKELLLRCPEGAVLNAIAGSLLAPDAPALGILFEALNRRDYTDLKGRPLGRDSVDARHRILEHHVLRTADARYRERSSGTPAAVDARVKALLFRELANADERRVRSAALLLGASGTAEAAPVLLQAFRTQSSAWSRALLLEALGRTDPRGATTEILASAASERRSERWAALPLLGYLRGDEVDRALREAIDDRDPSVQIAAVEACAIRRDVPALDLLIERLPKAAPRLQRAIYDLLIEVTGGNLPPDPQELPRWWAFAREDFRPTSARPLKPNQETRVFIDKSQYFGIELWSDRLAIVFDISGSMEHGRVRLPESAKDGEAGTAFEIMKAQIISLLNRLPGKAKFNLIAYSDGVTPFKKSIVPAARGTLRSASKFLDKLKAHGETNLYDAIMVALRDPQVDTIFLLSDGEPNQGRRVATFDILEGIEAVNRFRRVVINTVQIGQDQDLMRWIALSSGGHYRHIELAP